VPNSASANAGRYTFFSKDLDIIGKERVFQPIKGLRHYWQRKSFPTHFLPILIYYITIQTLYYSSITVTRPHEINRQQLVSLAKIKLANAFFSECIMGKKTKQSR